MQADSPPHSALEVRTLEGVCHLHPFRPWVTVDQPLCILRRHSVTRILSRYCWTVVPIPMRVTATSHDQLTRRERLVRAKSCTCSKNSKPTGVYTLHRRHGILLPCLISPRMRVVRLPHCPASPCQQTLISARHPWDVIRHLSDDLLSLRFTNPLLQPQFSP